MEQLFYELMCVIVVGVFKEFFEKYKIVLKIEKRPSKN